MLMPSDHPEPPALAPLDLEAHPAPPPAKGGGGKMQRLLRSAFKRGEETDQLSRSASESSSSAGSIGRTPSGRRAGRRGGDVDGDRSSRESFEAQGETLVVACFQRNLLG
jgi:hypothetical protein